MSDEEKIQALIQIAARAFRDYAFRTARLMHRFDRWGYGTSMVFLDAMEKEGYDLVRRGDDGAGREVGDQRS